MADAKARELLGRHSRLKSLRSPFENTWQQIAEVMLPRAALFNGRDTTNNSKGQRRNQRVFDAVPALALDRFAAAVHSLVTPKNQPWHKLTCPDATLGKSLAVQRYYETVTERLFKARYAGNFDNQAHECYYSLGAFATMGMFIGDTGTGIQYKSVPLWQLCFEENASGVVDSVFREYALTARNAVKEFDPGKLSQAVIRAAEKTPEQEFKFLDACMPREDIDASRDDYRGMPFVQYTVECESQACVHEEGYRTFPYAVSRYSVTPGEVYGRGPADIVLPDVFMLNDMNKTTMQAAQLVALPPLLTGRDGIGQAVRLTPGAVNHNMVSADGKPMAMPLKTGGDVGLGLEMMDQKRRVIQDAFWNTLFMILVDSPSMTATEAMLRAQEKGALLAPTASRIESEFLASIIKREVSILALAGVLPEPPPELVEAGLGYEVEYESPMALARQAPKGVAILRTFEQLAPVAQVDPGVFKRFNLSKTAKTLAEVNGVPADCMYSDEEMEAMKAQEQGMQEAASLLQAAPLAASAAKDLAQAQAISAAAPAGVAPNIFAGA